MACSIFSQNYLTWVNDGSKHMRLKNKAKKDEIFAGFRGVQMHLDALLFPVLFDSTIS